MVSPGKRPQTRAGWRLRRSYQERPQKAHAATLGAQEPPLPVVLGAQEFQVSLLSPALHCRARTPGTPGAVLELGANVGGSHSSLLPTRLSDPQQPSAQACRQLQATNLTSNSPLLLPQPRLTSCSGLKCGGVLGAPSCHAHPEPGTCGDRSCPPAPPGIPSTASLQSLWLPPQPGPHTSSSSCLGAFALPVWNDLNSTCLFHTQTSSSGSSNHHAQNIYHCFPAHFLFLNGTQI